MSTTNNHPNRRSALARLREPKPGETPIPQQIRERREAAQLTQSEAASLVHVGLRAWQKWEGEERGMPPGAWELFCIKTEERVHGNA